MVRPDELAGRAHPEGAVRVHLVVVLEPAVERGHDGGLGLGSRPSTFGQTRTVGGHPEPVNIRQLPLISTTPIAGKLRNRSGEEILHKEVTIEGIMSIQSGDNPRIVEQKLLAFLAPKIRDARRQTQEKAE